MAYMIQATVCRVYVCARLTKGGCKNVVLASTDTPPRTHAGRGRRLGGRGRL